MTLGLIEQNMTRKEQIKLIAKLCVDFRHPADLPLEKSEREEVKNFATFIVTELNAAGYVITEKP